MRKYQQKQMLQLLETIEEAQHVGLFADCQDVAIQLGEFIESLEGEGVRTVVLLEEYCELLYKFSTGKINERKVKKQLIKVKNSIEFDLKPNMIEVAFFPYNASMSDCLESIYFAAEADPGCDAYWVPIPYFDKRPDGTLGKMYYEGMKYPKNIKVIDWQKYDLEARCPDVIFIMNPYDNINFVTTVHPDYYAKRLRTLTELLVYVPYFVTSGETSPLFAIAPGVIYSKLTIVGSERDRQVYIHALKDWEIQNNGIGVLGNLEDKILALGSPKYDKAVNTKREDWELPDRWRKLIGDKKVVLYNTTIAPILRHDDVDLKKICEALNTFKTRDDVLLWWRPHPLMLETFESMRPQSAEEYKAIVAGYCAEAWGIYDDSSELYRAIAWSDIYYGDASSVVELCKAAGKPVMMRNEYLFNSEENAFYFSRGNSRDGYVYYFSTSYNAVFRIHKKSLTREFVFSVPGQDMQRVPFDWVANHATAFESKVFFIHRDGDSDYFVQYDSERGSFNKIRLLPGKQHGDYKLNNTNRLVFSAIYWHNGKLFCFPNVCDTIVSIDISTEKVTYYDSFVDEIKKLIPNENYAENLFGESIKVGDKLYIPCIAFSAVVVFDFNTCTSKLEVLGDRTSGNYWLLFDGESFWLTGQNNQEIIKWDETKGVVEVYDRGVAECEQCSFRHFAYFKGYIFFSTTASDRVPLKFDVSKGETSVASELLSIMDEGEYAIDLYASDQKLLFSTSTGKAYEISDFSGEYRCCELSPTDDEKQVIQKNVISQSLDSDNKSLAGCIYELPFFGLTEFLDLQKSNGIFYRERENGEIDSIGKKIYDNAVKRILSV